MCKSLRVQCLDDKQVHDYVRRRVPAGTVDEIHAHLDGCGACLSLVAAMIEPSTPAMALGPRAARPLQVVDATDYEILGTIAVGGMGRILAATDLRLERPIAIKELLVDDAHMRARFEREARITARLQHPAIVGLLEAGTWPSGEPFFAMKRVVGESLGKRLRKTGSLDERLGLLANVIALADALAYAHDQKVIHRDLKPDNVLLGDYGETVVIDWGLAKQLGGDDPVDAGDLARGSPAEPVGTVAGAVLGTPAYMPPEQALGEAVDERADVYALGAILYELLSGRPPYHGPSVESVLAAVVDGPPPRLRDVAPGVPRDLATIVEKAMAREPGARYRTAKPLADELRRFQTGQLVASHDYTLGQRLARWVRRYRAAVIVSAAALVALAVLVTLGVRGILEERSRADEERDAAVAARAEADTRRKDAEELMDFMLGDLRTKLEPLGKVQVLGAVAKKARDYHAGKPQPTAPEEQRRYIEARLNLGSVLSTQGDGTGALAMFREAAGMADRLPDDKKSQLLAVKCRGKLAGQLAHNGETAAARELFEAALVTPERMLAATPDDQEAMFWVHDTSYRLGEVLRAQGDLRGAMARQETALALARKLVARDPRDARWQRLLATALNAIATTHFQTHDIAAGAPFVRESADVSEAMLAADPTNPALQMAVVRTREKMAQVLEMQGDLDGALAAGLALRKTAVARSEQDPADATRRFDAAMAIRRVGMLRTTRKEYALAVAELREARSRIEALIAKDPVNKLWRGGLGHTLSALGSALEGNRQLADALAAYTASRDLRAALVAEDPRATPDRTDLAYSQELVANTLRDLGRLDAAIAEFGKLVALMRLTNAPTDDDRMMLVGILLHLGETQLRAARRGEARATYDEAIAIATELAAAFPFPHLEELATVSFEAGKAR